MKYKVGDKVRIKSIKIFHEDYSSYSFTPGMSKLCGKIATITDVYLGFYYIDIDKNNYCWTDEMFEEINKNNKMETKRVKITLPKNFEVEKVETSVEGGFLIVEYTPKYEPKVGDILIGKYINIALIYRGTESDGAILTNCFLKNNEDIIIHEFPSRGCGYTHTYHLATDEEKETFLSKLKEAGYTFNQETKKLDKIRWRAEFGQDYFIVSGRLTIEHYRERNDDTDDKFYFSHNYFKTKKEALDARDEIKELLKNR